MENIIIRRETPADYRAVDAQPGGVLYLSEFFGGAVRIKETADGRPSAVLC